MFRLHGTDEETLIGIISWHNNDYIIEETEDESENLE